MYKEGFLNHEKLEEIDWLVLPGPFGGWRRGENSTEVYTPKACGSRSKMEVVTKMKNIDR